MLNGLDNFRKLTAASLFAGIGGFDIALREFVRTVVYCEIEPYQQAVLLRRMQSGELDRAPIWDDVKTLRGGVLPKIDIIFGGFPCQDISAANNDAKGLDGERSGLFFEITRLAAEIRPTFIFMENSPMLTVRGLDRICAELSKLGYDCRFAPFSAADFGADHVRKRIYLLAHSNSIGLEEMESDQAYSGSKPENTSRMVLPKVREENISEYYRKDDGLPIPVGAIRSYGNAVLPVVAEGAFKKLMGLK